MILYIDYINNISFIYATFIINNCRDHDIWEHKIKIRHERIKILTNYIHNTGSTALDANGSDHFIFIPGIISGIEIYNIGSE